MNNKPKITEEFYPNGQLCSKSYSLNGEYHNPNGSAIEYYYENGQLEYKAYYINSQRHNPNGPAVEEYFENGQLEHKAYYINNKELCYKEFCIWQFENNIIKSKAELFKALLNE
jgi:antitoxin component YwqK of YwqJK toxin-antitoxin module